jgi:hypothetical protein
MSHIFPDDILHVIAINASELSDMLNLRLSSKLFSKSITIMRLKKAFLEHKITNRHVYVKGWSDSYNVKNTIKHTTCLNDECERTDFMLSFVYCRRLNIETSTRDLKELIYNIPYCANCLEDYYAHLDMHHLTPSYTCEDCSITIK